MRRDERDCFYPARPIDRARSVVDRHGAETIIEALEQFVGDARRARIRSVLDARVASVTVVLDAPHDPHNGAAVLRSCDAFGISTMHIIERREEFMASNAVAKGAERWVDVIRHGPDFDPSSALSGFELVGTHPEGELVPADLSTIPKLALVLGNERDGIHPALTEACRRRVRIPMRGFVESLNVSVSAALLTSAATACRDGDLPEPIKTRLYARAIVLSVSQAYPILEAQGLAT